MINTLGTFHNGYLTLTYSVCWLITYLQLAGLGFNVPHHGLKEKLFILSVGSVSLISDHETEKSDLATHFTSKNHCHCAVLRL